MTKTFTLRLKDEKYHKFKHLEECDNRSISNFIENATWRFIEVEDYLNNFENDEILSNKELISSIQWGCEQSLEGKGKFVKL